jgi:hypothetical protein
MLAVLPVLGDALDLTGDRSGTNVVLALVAANFHELVAAVAVNASVAAYLRTSGWRATMPSSWRGLADGSCSGRVSGIGDRCALFVSVVGIARGVRQLVRYQFAPQVVVLEGLDGRAALARSSELVRGRRSHTASTLNPKASFRRPSGQAGLTVSVWLVPDCLVT